MKTLLPEPVAPAINPCGILSIVETTASPAILTPMATVKGEVLSLNSTLSITSESMTGLDFLLGISIPTELFPGIGASIRISFAANDSFKSSDRLVILLTFTPRPN